MNTPKQILLFWILILGIMSIVKYCLGIIMLFEDNDMLLGSVNLFFGFLFSATTLYFIKIRNSDKSLIDNYFISVFPLGFILITIANIIQVQ